MNTPLPHLVHPADPVNSSDLRRERSRLIGWLAWRWNRVRCMSPAEIGHRAVRALTQRAERVGLFAPGQPSHPQTVPASVAWVHRGAAVDTAPYIAAAERIVAGRVDVFAMRDVELGS